MRKSPDAKGILVLMVTLALFLILDLVVAVYHLSTEGRDSGIAEIILAVVLVSLVVPAMVPTREARKRSRRILCLAAATVSVLIAIFMLFLAVYHLAHEGLRSGVVELCMAALLLILSWSLHRLEI